MTKKYLVRIWKTETYCVEHEVEAEGEGQACISATTDAENQDMPWQYVDSIIDADIATEIKQ